MKSKRLIIPGAIGILLVGYVILCIPQFRHNREWRQTGRALQSLSQERIYAATQAFAHDRKATNSVVPAVVSLRELVSSGYLSTEDIRGLEGRQVFVSVIDLTNDTPFIRADLSYGAEVSLFPDGHTDLHTR